MKTFSLLKHVEKNSNNLFKKGSSLLTYLSGREGYSGIKGHLKCCYPSRTGDYFTWDDATDMK